MENHLKTLKKKHAYLEQIITGENLRPYPDSQLIIELKQKKLRLKEEICSLIHQS